MTHGLQPDATRPPGNVASGGLVGRDAELASLQAALLSASAGRGSLVLIAGETGIGKTLLVDTLAERAAALGVLVLRGQAYDLENATQYGPWTGLLRSHAPTHSGSDPFIDVVDLRALAGPLEVYASVESLIVELAADQPVLILLEDQHWADQPSLDLLRYLTRTLSSLPVLIVLTYRDVELPSTQPLFHMLPSLVRESDPLRISLRPLERNAIEQLVDERYALDPRDSNRLVEYVWRYAEGNPFFTVELTVSLESQGTLNIRDGRWHLEELPEFRVPILIKQTIASRIALLTPETIELLRIASVIGTEIPIQLWREVSGASDDALSDCIEQALEASLIDQVEARHAVHFRHTLIREVLYDGLTLLRRQAWHRQIAEIMAGRAHPDPDSVAFHYRRAGDARALEWLIEAGRRAARRYTYHTAIARFEDALTVTELESRGSLERAWLLCELASAYRYIDAQRALRYLNIANDMADNLSDRALKAIVLHHRSQLRGFLGEHALDEFYQAVEMYDGLPEEDRNRINRSEFGAAFSRGSLAHRLVRYSRFSDVVSIGEQFLSASDPPSTPSNHYSHGLTHMALGISAAHLGDPHGARRHFDQSRAHFTEAGNHYQYGTASQFEYLLVLNSYFPEMVEDRRQTALGAEQAFARSAFFLVHDPGAQVRVYRALLDQGRWSEARESAEIFASVDYVRFPSVAALTELNLLQGLAQDARDMTASVMPLGPDFRPGTHYSDDFMRMQWVSAVLEIQAGNFDLARRWIDAYQTWLDWSGSVLGRYVPDLLLAQYHHARAERDLAIDCALRAVRRAGQPRQPIGLMDAHRTLGEILGTAPNHRTEAMDHLRQALSLAESFDNPYHVAIAEVAIAELLVREMPSAEVAGLIDDARERLQKLQAKPALDRLEQLQADPGWDEAPKGDIDRLTARELDVLRLAAQGLTDAEIGDRLFISRRTVSGHLQSIYMKIDVSTRTAAAAYAYEHDLVWTNC